MSDLGLGAVRQRLNASSFPILVLANEGGGLPLPPQPSVTEFQITDGVGPIGNFAPDWVIAGPNTTLLAPYGVAVFEGQIYVLDKAPDLIKVFPLAKGGDLKPTFSISGNNTELSYSNAIAIDKSGNVYVTGRDQVTVYETGARGDVAPTRRISGSNTGLSFASGIAVDQTGKIYVANGSPDHGSISVYAPDANGNVAPVAQIKGPQTRLGQPQALAVDTAGRIYVTNNPIFDPDSIVIFAPGANGNVAPIATINSGPTTGLYVQGAITIGAGDLIYVVNGAFATAVSVFPAGANGDVVPLATLSGGATLLRDASGIAIGHRWESKLLTRLLNIWWGLFPPPPLAPKVPPFPGPDPGPR